MKTVFILATMFFLVSCYNTLPSETEALDSLRSEIMAVEGIYEITSVTHNGNGCTMGNEIFEDQENRYILLKSVDLSIMGISILAFLKPTVEECEKMHRTVKYSGFIWPVVDDFARFFADSVSPGFESRRVTRGDVTSYGACLCIGWYVHDFHLNFNGTSLFIEDKISNTDTIPCSYEEVEGHGSCSERNTENHATACAKMITYSADFLKKAE